MSGAGRENTQLTYNKLKEYFHVPLSRVEMGEITQTGVSTSEEEKKNSLYRA